jgi:DNA-binding transcriptional regulator LsrR (DeoR family)
VATPSLRDALLGEPEIAAVVDAYASVTTAIVGIGAWGAHGEVAGSSLLASGALGADERSDLRRRGAVGELVVHPFDAAGRFIAPDLAERAVAISVDRLRAVRRVIAVAAGAPKAHAIRAALSTGVIDMLVTDAAAAGAVIAAGSGA